MNERIKQLAEQANELDYKTFDEYNHQTVQHYKFNKEKFAELIVRECAEEIKHLRMKYDTHRDVEPEENDWYIDAFLQAEVRLKEHFGVEE